MKQRIRLGLVCLARETYDFAAAAEIYKGIRAELSGPKGPEAVDWEVIPELVMSLEDAQKAARRFAESRLDAEGAVPGKGQASDTHDHDDRADEG